MYCIINICLYLCAIQSLKLCNMKETYEDFISSKVVTASYSGFDLDPETLHPCLFPHQRDIVRWAVKGGCRAVFASFGLGKTRMAIEIARKILNKEGGRALFIAPLGVRQEFTRKDGPAMGVDIQYIRQTDEATPEGYFITNYERVRLGDVDPNVFTVVLLDEASVLRSTGSDTFEVFMHHVKSVKYRFVFTATPSPNRYLELINYAHFLGVMDRGQALTRFFKRDSQKAGNLKIHPHKQREFWYWLCSWAIMLYRPSDLGYSDEGYSLPEMKVYWHEIPADHTKAWDMVDDDGQRLLLKHEAVGITEGAKVKRETMPARIEKMKQVIADFGPDANWLLWHHLEQEREQLEKQIPESVSVYGKLELEEREQRIIDFSDGKIQFLNTKPELTGSGCNFQHACSRNVFVGVNYEFNDFIQAIHRTYRFQQKNEVEVHIIHSEEERSIVAELKKKWAQHDELQQKMREIVSEHGLNQLAMIKELQRSSVIERRVEHGREWEYVNNDCTCELRDHQPDNSVGLFVTSIPFSNHYEYTPSYLDFGHTDDDNHFFAQMDYLIPEMLRTLKPGRLACIHVKDRIFYGSQTGNGFMTVNPFHAKTMFAFMQHGFEYMGFAIVPTDVVAENNQTYRLSYGEMVKDGTKMGFGSPEFVLVFRKPQTFKGKAYADEPVKKQVIGTVKKGKQEKEVFSYSLGRWQIDADALWRSSGDRYLPVADMLSAALKSKKGLGRVRDMYKDFCNRHGYNYAEHVKLAETLEQANKLPKVFSLMQPPTSEAQAQYIWDDVIRMRTLNLNQTLRKKANHICPLQIDVVDRCIERYSNPGDLVYDPFGGISTVPLRAVMMGRKGKGTELNGEYWRDGVSYLKEHDLKQNTPTLFDMLAEMEPDAPAESKAGNRAEQNA